jgi:hypothetical protein
MGDLMLNIKLIEETHHLILVEKGIQFCEEGGLAIVHKRT